MTGGIEVRGAPSAEELAAVLAAVAAATSARTATDDDAYSRWRRLRLAAQRAAPEPLRHNRQL